MAATETAHIGGTSNIGTTEAPSITSLQIPLDGGGVGFHGGVSGGPLITESESELSTWTLANQTVENSTYSCPDSLLNSTNSNCTEEEFGRNEDLAKLEIAIQAAILFLAIFGNGTVLLVLGTRKKKLSRMNMMIVHLCLADLFVAFFNVLPQMIWDITFRFYGGDIMCRCVKYLQVVAMYASSFVLVTTALDRYLAICHPLTAHTWTSRKMHVMISVAWLLSLTLGSPQLVIFALREIKPGSGVYDCWAVFTPEWTLQLYITWITVAIYIVPFILLTGLYGRICYVVWKSTKAREGNTPQDKKLYFKSNDKHENGSLLQGTGGTSSPSESRAKHFNPRAHVKGVSRAKVKTVKLTLAVIACYLLCWGPFFISQMWAAWDANAPFSGSPMTIIVLLASLNSCTNPWLYLIFTDNLCQKLQRIAPRHLVTVESAKTRHTLFSFGRAIVIMVLLASLNSCTNPWLYLLFSPVNCTRSLRTKTTRRRLECDMTSDPEARYKSLQGSRTDVTRLDTSSSRLSPMSLREPHYISVRKSDIKD